MQQPLVRTKLLETCTVLHYIINTVNHNQNIYIVISCMASGAGLLQSLEAIF